MLLRWISRESLMIFSISPASLTATEAVNPFLILKSSRSSVCYSNRCLFAVFCSKWVMMDEETRKLAPKDEEVKAELLVYCPNPSRYGLICLFAS